MANENASNQTSNVNDIAVHPGDSATYNRKLVQESYPYQQLTASTAVVTGPGVVAGFIVIATTSGVFTVYDSTAASGIKLFDSTGMTLTVGQIIPFPIAMQFNTGLYIAISGTLTLNAIYTPQ
jgi:hypothetical protein